jgi:hypothetical protein
MVTDIKGRGVSRMRRCSRSFATTFMAWGKGCRGGFHCNIRQITDACVMGSVVQSVNWKRPHEPHSG